MGFKRKRNNASEFVTGNGNVTESKKLRALDSIPLHPPISNFPVTIQIVAGSYDRILHGVAATLDEGDSVEFTDTFLFNAHTSAIRCLALSPPSAPVPGQTQKIILASGGTDERINLYHLSAHPPRKSTVQKSKALPSLNGNTVVEDPQNRELGSLLHHGSTISALHFPTRSKLLSSAEDSIIAVTRTRDWSLLSTIKAPIPKPQGRPSGDTAPLGGAPAGINDFAIHPSLKLMISVGKGEKCMRLWNLVTGKKAGVLTFEREMLMEVGESRFGNGEGRKVAWGSTKAGEEFCVGFEWGVLVFGMDSKPRCRVLPAPRTKLHQLRYISKGEDESGMFAVSTEDGRILFYSTETDDLVIAPTVGGKEPALPSARLVAQLGGKEANIAGRIKDFTTVELSSNSEGLLLVTGNSDGAIRLWRLSHSDLSSARQDEVKQVGTLLGMYETGNRITCLQAFVMIPRESDEEEVEVEVEMVNEGEETSDSDY